MEALPSLRGIVTTQVVLICVLSFQHTSEGDQSRAGSSGGGASGGCPCLEEP